MACKNSFYPQQPKKQNQHVNNIRVGVRQTSIICRRRRPQCILYQHSNSIEKKFCFFGVLYISIRAHVSIISQSHLGGAPPIPIDLNKFAIIWSACYSFAPPLPAPIRPPNIYFIIFSASSIPAASSSPSYSSSLSSLSNYFAKFSYNPIKFASKLSAPVPLAPFY